MAISVAINDCGIWKVSQTYGLSKSRLGAIRLSLYFLIMHMGSGRLQEIKIALMFRAVTQLGKITPANTSMVER